MCIEESPYLCPLLSRIGWRNIYGGSLFRRLGPEGYIVGESVLRAVEIGAAMVGERD